jgi:hypothetical protein
MDRHLNAFNGYAGGRDGDPAHMQLLEDNVTRAFIVVLRELHRESPSECCAVLYRLSGLKFRQALDFDLQDLSDRAALRRLQRSDNRKVLLISRYGDSPKWNGQKLESLHQFQEKVLHLAADGADRKSILKALERAIANQAEQLVFDSASDLKVPADEFHAFWELLKGARPDAWIFEKSGRPNPATILIETKVGSNRISPAQVYRHITSGTGFGVSSPTVSQLDQLVISSSWSKVKDVLLAAKVPSSSASGYLIGEFSEYLAMSGEVLDLLSLNKDYDTEAAQSQFNLLLDRLDESFSGAKYPLSRKNRRKHQLWDGYHPRLEGSGRPWISVGMNNEGIGCSLNFSSSPKRMAEKILLSDEFQTVLLQLKEQDPSAAQRYYFSVVKNRLLDWKNGQQHGERYEALRFRVCLKHVTLLGDDEIDSMIDIARLMLGNEKKEISLEMRVDWVDAKKALTEKRTSSLRRANHELFANPDRLVDTITQFVGTVIPVITMK